MTNARRPRPAAPPPRPPSPSSDVLVFLIPCVINGAMLIYFLTGLRSQVPTADEAGESDPNLSLTLAPTQLCEGGVMASDSS
jgi:hypothetical protein